MENLLFTGYYGAAHGNFIDKRDDRMWELFTEGGWFMVPIGVCLFLTLTIAIERLVNLRTSRFLDESLMEKIRSCLGSRDAEGALTVCRSKNVMFNRLMETAIVYRQIDKVELRQLLEDQSRQEARVLERYLNTLRTIATIAPLLGLLGTVAGMIKVFQTLSMVGATQIGDLSVGISEALITTAAGMSVAIPTIVLHNLFEGRAAKIMLYMEKRLIELLLLVRSRDAISAEA